MNFFNFSLLFQSSLPYTVQLSILILTGSLSDALYFILVPYKISPTYTCTSINFPPSSHPHNLECNILQQLHHSLTCIKRKKTKYILSTHRMINTLLYIERGRGFNMISYTLLFMDRMRWWWWGYYTHYIFFLCCPINICT